MKKDRLTKLGIGLSIPIFILMALFALAPNQAEAGIYAENSETTYQENWIPHTEFTGGCSPETIGTNKWYIEPGDCDKTLEFTLPNVNNINKIEIYIDLWRNRNDLSARFSINGGTTIKPNVGADWSRTPYIHEFTGSELNDFVTGANTITFWDQEGEYHVHDVAIRIYSNASDVATTEGFLHKIRANGVDYDPYNSGPSNLTVNSDQLQVSAQVSGTARFVEFHAFYDGYDDDNDGDFSDWHNVNNNNWNDGHANSAPGIDNPNPVLGGTINHIQTLEVTTPGIYTATWNLPHIVSQNNVRFKIRIVDDNNFVRDAAGGDSRNFSLVRNTPSAYFINPNFENMVLHHDGDPGYEEELSTTVVLPDDLSDFDSAYLIGAYFNNLYISINGETQFKAFLPPANNSGRWDLSITNDVLVSGNPHDIFTYLQPGVNTITYYYWNAGGQWGSLIEEPGPMIVLKREDSGGVADNKAPDLYNASPDADASFVEVDSNIAFSLFDAGSGVNTSSIVMEVNNVEVVPAISNGSSGTRVTYNPGTLPFDTLITVDVAACDNSANCMNESYSFRTVAEDSGATAVSDDFNVCTTDDLTANWTFVDPKGDSSFGIGEDYDSLTIYVPAGSSHDPHYPALTGKKPAGNESARLMQPASNSPNFVVETKFFSMPTDPYQMQGMIVEQDANDYIRFDVTYNGTELRAYVATFVNGVETRQANKILPAGTGYILIHRENGSTWNLHHSLDGNSWKPVVSFTHTISVNNVGVYAGNAQIGSSPIPAYTAEFDYLFDWGSDFVGGEDAESLALPVEISGEGSVDKSVDCGKPLTLTATPEIGWSFDHWSGASSSTQNPLTLNDWDKNETITAHFTRDEYTVTIDASSYDHTGAQTTDNAGGTITQSQATYYYGDTVELTAVPTAGWSLTSWSGAGLSGNNSSKNFTITQNETINVRFDQDKYDLDIVKDGPGNVVISSVGESRGYYIYGDEVTLTAVETNSDYKFRGWSGSINSSDNPVTFILTEGATVTALFSDSVNIFLPVIKAP